MAPRIRKFPSSGKHRSNVERNIDHADKKIRHSKTADKIICRLVEFVGEENNSNDKSVSNNTADTNDYKNYCLSVDFCGRSWVYRWYVVGCRCAVIHFNQICVLFCRMVVGKI